MGNALHRDILAFDIEARPALQAIRDLYQFKSKLVEPEWETIFTPEQDKFDPESVTMTKAIENIKDEALKEQKMKERIELESVKFTQKLETAKQKFYNDLAEKKQKFHDKKMKEEDEFWAKLEDGAALNAMTLKVITLVFCDENGPESHAFISEGDMLQIFWDRYENIACGQERRKVMVGHNIFGYDLPVMIQRSWACGVQVPNSVRQSGKPWWNDLFIDLMKEFNHHQYGKLVSLKRMAKFFGVAQDREYEIDGANYWKALGEYGEDALIYAEDDGQETYDCANIILNGKYPDAR